jgi:hypothetical protein
LGPLADLAGRNRIIQLVKPRTRSAMVRRTSTSK